MCGIYPGRFRFVQSSTPKRYDFKGLTDLLGFIAMKRYALITISIVSFVVLWSSCRSTPSNLVSTSVLSPLVTPLSPTIDVSRGAILGYIDLKNASWSRETLYIYAAPFYPTDGEQGFFILEPTIHPYGPVYRDGYFVINNVPPGKYVLVVGPAAESAVAIRNPKGAVRIFTVEAGRILNVGVVTPYP